jgi:hypothetical protein
VHIPYVATLAPPFLCCMRRHAAAAWRGACRGEGTLAATVGLAGWRRLAAAAAAAVGTSCLSPNCRCPAAHRHCVLPLSAA